MTVPPLVDTAPAVSPGTRRSDVLAVLQRSARPVSVTDVARATDLHVNTARFHLDALVDAGMAARSSQPRQTPGRPRVLYHAVGDAVGPRSYTLLAEMLTGLVAGLPSAEEAAADAGRSWGRHLVDRAAPSQRVDTDDALARLNRLLDRVGFQPQSEPRDGGWDVRLRHCPFREVAERHTDVVCALHRGLMQGALDELRAPLDTELEPFAAPDACIARLRPAAPPR